MTTQLLKLSNGDEIIGDVINQSSDKLTINNPLIIETRNNNGGMAFVLNKYLSFSKDATIDFNMNNIVAISSVSSDMESYYMANVDYIKRNIEPSFNMNIKRGLSYFQAEMIQDELSDIIEDDESEEMSDEEFMQELLKELEPPSKLKH